MQNVKVTLGGSEYEITQLPLKGSREWRQKFAAPLEQILGAVQQSAGALQKAFDDKAQVNAGELVAVIGQTLLGGVGHILLGSMDLILEMVYAYAPNIRAAQETIEASAYDDEVMLAFVEVLKLAYPFGQIVTLVQPGRLAKPTKKN